MFLILRFWFLGKMNINCRKFCFQSLLNWNDDDDDKLYYWLIIMGIVGVGKSCIIFQFLYDCFISEYKEIVEEFYCGEYIVDGCEFILDILDIVGVYLFLVMCRLVILISDVFVLVYLIDDEFLF